MAGQDEIRYSVTIRDRQHGPFGIRQLQEFADSGQITPRTVLVSTRGHQIEAATLSQLRFPGPPISGLGSATLAMGSGSLSRASAPAEGTPPDGAAPGIPEGADATLLEVMDFDSLEAELGRRVESQPSGSSAVGSAPAEPSTGDTKRCPFCAEVIKAKAIKCRFCGEWLDGRENKPEAPAAPTAPAVAAPAPSPGDDKSPVDRLQYRVVHEQGQEGPYSKAELQDLVERGRIHPTTVLITPTGATIHANKLTALHFDRAYARAEFRLKRANVEYGPYSLDQIRGFARSGKLDPTTILQVGQGVFLPARDIAPIWSATPGAPAAAVPGAASAPPTRPAPSPVVRRAASGAASRGRGQRPSAGSSKIVGAVIIAAAIGLFWFLGKHACGSDDKKGESMTMEQRAVAMCHQEVSKKLKDPTSAMYDTDPTVKKDDDGFYLITGTMRAKNSFGAYVGGSYMCRLKHKEGKTWLVPYAFPAN